MKYVIIGNSTAAFGCIEGIRRNDPQGSITVLSAETHPYYGRPLISYYLQGKTTLENIPYKPASWYEENQVVVRYGVCADKIKKKAILTDAGDSVPFDRLCICTGSRPFVPPFDGLDSVREKFTFQSLDDALALEKALSPEKKVLIIGAGLIGLKCAEGIRDHVAGITVCDMADRVLPSVLDTECAAVVQKHLEANGLTFMLNDSVTSFHKNTATFKSGKTLEFDLLILAVGVRANTQLAADYGLTVNRGIVIDDHCRTSDPSIYAAGDCAEGINALTGASQVIAILPNAYLQGETAGINMAGGEITFDKNLPLNSVGFFGLHIASCGCYDGEKIDLSTEGNIKRLFRKDNKLRGFILIGNTLRAGIYTALIREKTPLSSIDFNLICDHPTLMAFSGRKRSYLINERNK